MRKAIQVSAYPGGVVALCDDGTIWKLGDGKWNKLPDLPDSTPSSPSPPSPHTPHPPIPTPTPLGELSAPAHVASAKTHQLKLLHTSESLPNVIGELIKAWNQIFSLPRVHRLGGRLEVVKKSLQDEFFIENWREGLKKLARSPFCLGKNPRGWKADIEWFCDTGNLDKLLSGKYDGKDAKVPTKNFDRTEI